MFESLLIANRGEIACRIIRTARNLGLRTVAVYSDADVEALHVEMADTAYRLGPPPARESYLNQEALLSILAESGAEAVHPGYGFLAESADFAEAVAQAGAVFVGPPASAIRAMGSKSAAKALMAKAGVPLLPGYHGEDQSPERLAQEARALGFPLLIKAAAGGGGKGMRIVREESAFGDELSACRREAEAAFGDGKVLLERYLERPRHVEIQVFADSHGRTLHLFERDCSLQRRYQKVIEEAPAPDLPEALRRAMGEAAVAAAEAVGYRGAGTVEFLVERANAGEERGFYFMEMNTRLQVEHPVTEAITGLDLVAWQLKVAAGEPLPLAQEEILCRGHAIEARLYAEDPQAGFLPATGRVRALHWPASSGGDLSLRIDSGLRAGDSVTTYYDPMLAKVVVHGPDRDAARKGLERALSQIRLLGLTTNAAFLRRLLAEANFAAGEVETGLIERNLESLLRRHGEDHPAPPALFAALAIVALESEERGERRSSVMAAPWRGGDSWRLNLPGQRLLRLEVGDRDRTVPTVVTPRRSEAEPLEVHLQDEAGLWRTCQIRFDPDGGLFHLRLAGRNVKVAAVREGARIFLDAGGGGFVARLPDPVNDAQAGAAAAGGLAAPMPGRVTEILISEGERVVAGQRLLVLEAMKMEHVLRAPAEGRIAGLKAQAGDSVEEGAELLVIEAAESDA